jgi:hypothetical protein
MVALDRNGVEFLIVHRDVAVLGVATGNFTEAWLYMIAPLVGAVMATLVHAGLKRVAGEEPTIGHAVATPAE